MLSLLAALLFATPAVEAGDSANDFQISIDKMQGSSAGVATVKLGRHVEFAGIKTESAPFAASLWVTLRQECRDNDLSGATTAGRAAAGTTWWNFNVDQTTGGTAAFCAAVIDLCGA